MLRSSLLVGLVIIAVSAVAGGCTFTYTALPSGRPGLVEGSNRPISGLPGRRVLVLSPVSLQQVAPDVTLETTGAPATAGATASGVLHVDGHPLPRKSGHDGRRSGVLAFECAVV